MILQDSRYTLSSCKQPEYPYLIPFCKDLIRRGNLAVDHKIGVSALQGEVLIFLNHDAGKPVDGRALGDIQNLPLHTCKGTEQT